MDTLAITVRPLAILPSVGLITSQIRPIAVQPAGQADYQSPRMSPVLTWTLALASLTGTVLGAYRGYKRDNSVGWAIWWGIAGGWVPFITIPLSLAQGFGKRARG